MQCQGVNGDLSQIFKHSWREKQTQRWLWSHGLSHEKGSLCDMNSNHYWIVGGCWVLTTVIWYSHLAIITQDCTTWTIMFSSPWTSLRFRNKLANPRSCHTFFISALTTCPHQYPTSDPQTPPTLTAALAKIANHSQLLPAFPTSAFSTTARAWGSGTERNLERTARKMFSPYSAMESLVLSLVFSPRVHSRLVCLSVHKDKMC